MERFEWDPMKALSNLKKHGVSFDEALTVFGDPLHRFIYDEEHDGGDEARWVAIGRSADGRLLRVVYSEPETGLTRIISAKEPTRLERESYEETE